MVHSFLVGPQTRPLCEGDDRRSHVLYQSCPQGIQRCVSLEGVLLAFKKQNVRVVSASNQYLCDGQVVCWASVSRGWSLVL